MRPSRKYYERNVPPDSFIHADDFGFDTKKLSEYLQKVASDINLYKKHFEWKKMYRPVFAAHDVEMGRLCELCYRLNTEKKVGYYTSVSKFFNQDCTRL